MASIPATFKAYEYQHFGDFLDEIKFNPAAEQKPVQPNEVKIKVFSASLNPIDYKIGLYASMILSTMASPEHPYRVGHDLSGKVVEVGSDVEDYKVGDEVFAMPWFDATGTFAEYINVDTKRVAHKPSNMTFNEAAGVPLAGQTSWQGLVTYGKLQKGQRVLILGGSSGTGLFAIQIAKALGAEVVATCSHRNVELVKSLGADQVIDYTNAKWSEVLAEHSVDLIYDCGVESQSWNDAAQKVLKEQTDLQCTMYGVSTGAEEVD
ncbi:Zinc-binding dehydrogenase [Phytophthora infestans]|uniref:Zinc-binding dehydrogenase n=1 Tax=Phytophthora infestans TaxID=4787 RepID=A0A833TQ89_PHYIN|nr:Zinc-binding dehydrogenase [Phytophthora infestans]KAF4132873.1 Zinc-binding dehydrogenase [Phytophthora infestans]